MLNDVFRRLDEACPWLSRWLGGRLDIQVPAIAVSVLTHAVILALFGMIGYAATSERKSEIDSALVDLDDFATLDDTEIMQIDDTVATPTSAATAPMVAPMIVQTPSGIAPSEDGPPLVAKQVVLANHIVLPAATRLDMSVAVRGQGAEHVADVEGAVDRIAVEILRKLEKGRTLVVWAFDASGSLQEERGRLAKYIGRVYKHIAELDTGGLAEHEGLLTVVVAFGKDRRILAEPTADVAAITRAINAVALDASGVESTFQTVGMIAAKYARFKKGDNAYAPMTVVVTDEVGDDEGVLESVIATARKANMPVYVLGSPALFGRVEGFMAYTDPKTGEFYRRLPVRQGPESVEVEMVKLPFWYAGPQYDLMDSGFGPWALSRLASQTGGIYFLTRLGTAEITFNPAGMREYRPDWSSREEYSARIVNAPVRRAVTMAGRITQQRLPDPPSLEFPAADGPQFKEEMARTRRPSPGSSTRSTRPWCR